MSGSSSLSRFCFALLLTVTLIGNWAVCTVVCEERSEHHSEGTRQHESEEIGLASPEHEDDCPINGTVGILQDRQTVPISNPPHDVSTEAPFTAPDFDRSVPIPETGKKSPPVLSRISLFLRLCTFRI